MKRYIKPNNNTKPIMNASQKHGYNMAMPYIKKYAKAMKVLGK